MEEYTVNSETLNLLNDAFRTNWFSWDSERNTALQDMFLVHARLQGCHVSYIPRRHFERCKLLAVLTREGWGTGSCGSHPLLTRNHWPLWKWSQAILDPLSSHSDSLLQLHVVTSSMPDSGDRQTTSRSLSQHAVTQTRLPGRRSPELCCKQA